MDRLKRIIETIPKSPGVYQFLDKNNSILYIGKAKNLQKRVSSYCKKPTEVNYKSSVLVNQIFSIKYIVVENESDALLLENNLIKKFKPKYNVLLKDDKTYPWICIKNETFPRVFSTRQIKQDGSEYFGPYTSSYMVKVLLDLIRHLYKLRTCSLNLTLENVKKEKFKKCLEYHLGNCNAPCEALQSESEYDESIRIIKNILKGNIQEVIVYLKNRMHDFSKNYNYEDAELCKQRIVLLERYKSKSTIVSNKYSNIDVFSFVKKEQCAAVNFLKIIKGSVVQAHTIELKKRLDETDEELLLFAIVDIRQRVNSDAKEIIVPFSIPKVLQTIQITVPKTGDKKKLLELSNRNAQQYFIQKQLLSEKNKTVASTNKLLERVQLDLQLKELPSLIECFDNSNLQGEVAVAACVVFINGRPAKREYRHYNIKSVKGINDFATMEEVIYRRYSRILKEKKQLPKLIIIDGGKGQLTSAVTVLKKLGIYNSVPAIGIAKKLEEIYFPEDAVPLYLEKKSPTLKLIQQIRNEAHRFGITFHRNKRSIKQVKSMLTSIKGIGRDTEEKLLKKFGSVEALKTFDISQISEVVGIKKASIICNYFRSENL